MLGNTGKMVVSLMVAAGLFTTAAFSAGTHESEGKEHKHQSAAPGVTNPLLAEMRLLDEVFREVVSAVSLGDGQRVHHALHSMHGTMEKTHEGVHGGTVKIPKNADKLDTFVKMDTDFHSDLEKLAAVASKNDQRAMVSLTKGLLDGCVNCHRMFR